MKKALLGLFLLLAWWLVHDYRSTHDGRDTFGVGQMPIEVRVNGASLFFEEREVMSVAAFLEKAGFVVRPEDEIFPDRETGIISGLIVVYVPAREIMIKADKENKKIWTTDETAEEILATERITLDEDDIVEPKRERIVPNGGTIVVTRVEIKEEFKDIPIAFTTKTTEDDELSWRKTIVKQKGEKGVKRTTYRVAYHDGKEVNRRTVKTEVTKEPVEEIITQGTYVKTGKSHRGAASWYAWTGTMAAANPWLPKGSYVRVTNLDNGKSVIVVINDRGPFVPGRIIDLDKVAFAKIASVGAGVINVKMEEITN